MRSFLRSKIDQLYQCGKIIFGHTCLNALKNKTRLHFCHSQLIKLKINLVFMKYISLNFAKTSQRCLALIFIAAFFSNFRPFLFLISLWINLLLFPVYFYEHKNKSSYLIQFISRDKTYKIKHLMVLVLIITRNVQWFFFRIGLCTYYEQKGRNWI